MTHSFRHGLVIGKFYPPHNGHEYLIRCAASQCDHVSVIVMAGDAEGIALALRVRWMAEILADQRHVVVTGVTDDDVVDFDSESAWRAHVGHMQRGLILANAARAAPAPAVDAVFTSERYGEELARRFAAAAVCVDHARARYPMSGTAFRADPAGRWFDVAPCVREYLCRRVAIVGAESTGKTTLAGALQQAFLARGGAFSRTRSVAEFGREYTERKLGRARAQQADFPVEALAWTSEDFEVVAREQVERENAAARDCGPLLICDTDAFATTIWHERYMRIASPAVQAIAATALPRLGYLLTSWAEVPFEQDGLRDGEEIRHWMHERFRSELERQPTPWLLVAGTLEQRTKDAMAWIDAQLEVAWRF
jgi:HTH-type transcriptional regulator, transcriptional repressor of NAD biosynthesis genes